MADARVISLTYLTLSNSKMLLSMLLYCYGFACDSMTFQFLPYMMRQYNNFIKNCIYMVLLSRSKKESERSVHLPGTAQMPLKWRANGAPHEAIVYFLCSMEGSMVLQSSVGIIFDVRSFIWQRCFSCLFRVKSRDEDEDYLA